MPAHKLLLLSCQKAELDGPLSSRARRPVSGESTPPPAGSLFFDNRDRIEG